MCDVGLQLSMFPPGLQNCMIVPCCLSNDVASQPAVPLGGCRPTVDLLVDTIACPVQIFIGGEFIGGASQLIDLIAKDGLQAQLKAAEGKSAFPKDIADLVAAHAKEQKPTVDPEVAALGAKMKDKLTRVKCAASCDCISNCSSSGAAAVLTVAVHHTHQRSHAHALCVLTIQIQSSSRLGKN